MSGDVSLGTDLAIRPYRDADEPEVLELLRVCLGGGPGGERTSEFFRWKHLENPFGRSFMIVAESDTRIIGFRALMRWRFRVGDRAIEAVRPVDTCTHPDHRGRGVFSRLTRTALESLRGEIDLVFNTPNPDSLAGYLKMGWRVAGRIPVSIALGGPAGWRVVLPGHARSRPDPPLVHAPTAGEVLADEHHVATLIEEAEVLLDGYSTPVTPAYLQWRYALAPHLGYHAVVAKDRGQLAGIAFFRLRPQGASWGLSIGNLIVRTSDGGTARRLLRATRQAADIAYVAMTFPRGSAAARARRFSTALRAPRGIVFAVNPLRSNLSPDPTLLSSWALSMGDVEVF